MPTHRTVSTLVGTLAVLLLGSTASVAAPDQGQWQDPQVIDDQHQTSLTGLAANAGGVHAVWRGDGRSFAAHRDPGPAATWSAPRLLERSGGNLLESGPTMALPSGGAVVFATVAGAERTFTWRISADGVPGPRREFPFNSFTPSAADHTASGRWLVAGTRSGVPGPLYVAVRSASGSWRMSKQLPTQGDVSLVAAWFDRNGVPHVIAVEPVADSLQASGGEGRAIIEAKLRRDGSWTQPRQIATTLNSYTIGSPYAVANDDGDVTLEYVRQVGATDQATQVTTRPFGGRWHEAVQFPQETPALAIDELGRTFVVRAGSDVHAGRIGQTGALVDGWQQLTDAEFDNDVIGRLQLTISRQGSAVVGVYGDDRTTDPESNIERYFRCLPDQTCVRVGDFNAYDARTGTNSSRDLVTGAAGAVWAVSSYTRPCADGVLCSWRLPAP